MIIISLKGGLGNQLFQIFTCMNYSIESKKEFFIDDSHYNLVDDRITKRETYWNSIFKELKNKSIKWDKRLDGEKFDIFKEKGFEYNEIPKYKGDICLIGYFQSYKYFEKNYNTICEVLNIRKKKEDIIKKYKYDYKNLCSIHFRIGDYKKNLDCHLILSEKYYKSAINIMLKKGIKKFLVFYEKDDIKDVNRILDSLNSVAGVGVVGCNGVVRGEFIMIDCGIVDYDQILIMSNCFGNIIANSSFSWWGAYLNYNKNVCYPSSWFGKKMAYKSLKDLFPTGWQVVNT